MALPSICLAESPISVQVDGRELSFNTAPIIKDGSILLPLRTSMEAIGCRVSWNEDARVAEVVSGSTTVLFSPGSSAYTVNGEEKTLDAAPEIIDEQLFIPIRSAAEALGAIVAWDADSSTLTISSPQSQELNRSVPARDLMEKAWNAATELNTFKFKQRRYIEVKTSMDYSWGKSYQSKDISYEESTGSRKARPSERYEHIKSGIPPVNGRNMVESDNYEKVTAKNAIYIKTPDGIWVKTDEQTPAEFFASMGKSEEDIFKDIDMRLEPDEKYEGKDCSVVFFNYKPGFFQPLVERLVEEQLAVSETDPDTGKSIWEQVKENQQVSGSGRVWIDKSSGLEIHQESKFKVKFVVDIPVQESEGHTMRMVYEMQDSINENRFEYGKPVVIPDVSKAISMEEYMETQSKLYSGNEL